MIMLTVNEAILSITILPGEVDRQLPDWTRPGEVLWGYTKISRDVVQGAFRAE